MKILMICEFFDESLEYQENLLLKYYEKHQHEVTLLTSTYESIFDFYKDNYDSSLPRREFFVGQSKVVKLPYSYNILNRLRKLKDVVSILEETKPDLIFLHDISLNIHDAIKYKSRNPQCIIIMDYHADYSNSGKNWISINILHRTIRNYFFLKPSRKYLSKIFPVVPASTKFLNEIYGVSLDEMELLPLGVDMDTALETQKNQLGKEVRKFLNIPEDDFIIFTGGKLNENKKTDMLIDVLVKLNNPKVHLIIVGVAENNNYKQELERKVDSVPNVHMVGWLKKHDMYAHLNAADIAVFPASQSVLWQQSLSMGLPLIVGNIGDQSISYLNNYNNIIELSKEQITVDYILSRVILIIQDDNLRMEMRKGAHQIAAEMLDWNSLIQKTLRFNKDA